MNSAGGSASATNLTTGFAICAISVLGDSRYKSSVLFIPKGVDFNDDSGRPNTDRVIDSGNRSIQPFQCQPPAKLWQC